MSLRDQARSACEQGDIPNALQLWAGITAGNAAPQDLLEYGLVLDKLYALGEAAVVFERLFTHSQTTTEQFLVVAKQLFSRARFQDAAKFLERACALEPENIEYTLLLATCLNRSGENTATLNLLEPFLKTHSDHGGLIRQIAHLERRQGLFHQSRERMEVFLRKHDSADNWGVKYELASVLDRLGEHEKAMQLLLESKREISAQSEEFYPIWRAATQRQWELTKLLDRNRLLAWEKNREQLRPKFKLCLLAGFPRSATTLLERVLSTSNECTGTDESGILAAQFRDPLVLHAPSTAEALAELESFSAEELSAGRAEYLRCSQEYIGEKLDGRWLIEKDPLLTADLAVPLRLFPDAKILMPLRDPRDVVLSFFFTLVPLSSGSVAAISLAQCCQYYAEVMRHWLHLREIIPAERWLQTRYEDLLAEPEAQTRKIAEFLEIKWSPKMISHHQTQSQKPISTPSYDDVSKPLYTRALGRWRNYEKHLEPHVHHLQPYLEAFGYET